MSHLSHTISSASQNKRETEATDRCEMQIWASMCNIGIFFTQKTYVIQYRLPRLFHTPASHLREKLICSKLSTYRKDVCKQIYKNFKWTGGFIFSLFIPIDSFACFRDCMKLYRSKLVCKYSLFHLKPVPWPMEIVVKLPPGLSSTGNLLIYFYLSQQVKLTKSRCYMALNLDTGTGIVCWR